MKALIKRITSEKNYQKLRYPLIFKRTLSNILYDAKNFIRHSALSYQPKDATSYSAILTMEYHKLEKAISLPSPKKLYGKSISIKIIDLISNNSVFALECLEDTHIALKVLEDYCKVIARTDDVENLETAESVSRKVQELSKMLPSTIATFPSGVLPGQVLTDDFEYFLQLNKNRKSIRNFSNESVPREKIFNAVDAAKYTPSVCNRQPWKIYYLDCSKKIVNALRFQNGNSGFREKIPGLIIVTSSSKHFPLSGERNQLWIDGGMFSMNLLFSLHASGLGACALNWGNDSFIDIQAKESIGIKSDESIIMMIAVGYPNENYKVCVSHRKDTKNFITLLN